jgi:hypothetical protein
VLQLIDVVNELVTEYDIVPEYDIDSVCEKVKKLEMVCVSEYVGENDDEKVGENDFVFE